jgi:hypothetical protein
LRRFLQTLLVFTRHISARFFYLSLTLLLSSYAHADHCYHHYCYLTTVADASATTTTAATAATATLQQLPADPLNQCIDITSIGGASPGEISMRSYARRPGSTEVYSKFYTREKWSPKQFGDSDMCIGYSLQKPYRAGGWKVRTQHYY